MKLRNKKTGEIGELVYFVSISLSEFNQYTTKENLLEEWEEIDG